MLRSSGDRDTVTVSESGRVCRTMASPGRQARLQRDLEAITALCSAHQFLQGELAKF